MFGLGSLSALPTIWIITEVKGQSQEASEEFLPHAGVGQHDEDKGDCSQDLDG